MRNTFTKANAEAATEFLFRLNRNGCTVASIDPRVPGAPTVRMYRRADRDKVKKFIDDRSKGVDGMNLHLMVNPTRRHMERKPTERDIHRYEWAHVEGDPLPGEDSKTANARHRKAMMACVPAPTIIYSSGNGVVALWKLKEPVTIHNQADVDRCKGINIALGLLCGGAAAGIDSSHSIDHLLRLPHTLNIPDARKKAKGRKPVMAGYVDDAGHEYTIDQLPAPAPVSAKAEVDIGEPVEVNLDDLPLDDDERIIIADGSIQWAPKEGDNSASSWRMDLICRLLRKRVPDEQILGILTDPENGIHERSKGRVVDADFGRQEIATAHGLVDDELTDASDDFADDYFTDEDKAKLIADSEKVKGIDRMRGLTHDHLLSEPSPKWLVRQVMVQGGLFEIYGKWKSGKTFWGLEIALCIVTGIQFFGMPVTQGSCLYVIAEGNRKLFGYRVEAWIKARSKDDAVLEQRLRTMIAAHLRIVPTPVLIDVDVQVTQLMKANPGSWDLVVIDTLFRSMQGDVMNPGDFAKFVAGCDRIRRKFSAAVLFLHHQKRSEAKGGFGSVVGEASVDAAYKVTSIRKRYTVFNVEFMRDGDADQKPWVCNIEVYSINDPDFKEGDVDTVGVLVFDGRGSSKGADSLLQTIRDHNPKTIDAIVAVTGKPRRTIDRHLKTLREAGLLDGLTLTEKGIARTTDIDDLAAEDEDTDD